MMNEVVPKYRIVTLTIEGFTPHTLPMAKLAEYLSDFAKLLGHREVVHFLRVGKGSAALVSEIDERELPTIAARIHLVKTGDAPPEAQQAARDLNLKLCQDETTAVLRAGRIKLLKFPATIHEAQAQFGPVIQHGSIDGILIKIGGRDETVPVHIDDGTDIHICNATRKMAKKLAPCFDTPICVFGTGRWIRDNNGKWIAERLNIAGFEPLDDAALPMVIERLRAIPGNEWDGLDDPLAELRRIRKDGKVQ